MQKCKQCPKEFERIRIHTHRYLDERGKPWRGLVCPDCSRDRMRVNFKKYADKTTAALPPSQMTPRRAELTVAEFFRAFGTQVDLVGLHGRGPDLTVRMDKEITVEVKMAGWMKWKGTYRTSTVKPQRRSDDLIAIVFPSGNIHIEPMCEHLAKCQTSGHRYLPKKLSDAMR